MTEIESLTHQLKEKYDNIGQNTQTHLEGLLYSKPINYWDYIQTDALLNLQIQRTTLPDEMVFIMYHQVNELLFKMILWELHQISEKSNIDIDFFAERLMRVSRYFDTLTSSFTIMKDGMEVEQYMKFRNTLTPASGFQSEQYRKIEIACTDIINLIDARYRTKEGITNTMEDAFEYLYWQAGGKDYKTNTKTYTLSAFETRYKNELIRFANAHKTKNLWAIYKQFPQHEKNNPKLIKAMRHLDYTINITWVMAHYNSANHYLNSGNEAVGATGGSEWVKYMHPKYQKRIFFPELWTEQEKNNWGENN